MAPISGAIFLCAARKFLPEPSGRWSAPTVCGICARRTCNRLIAWHIGYQNGEAALTPREARVGGAMTDMVEATAPTVARVSDTYRWTQLAIGVAAMVMIANYQYGWTFFVPDIQKKFGWDRASIQWAFTLFGLFEDSLVPVGGWFVAPD